MHMGCKSAVILPACQLWACNIGTQRFGQLILFEVKPAALQSPRIVLVLTLWSFPVIAWFLLAQQRMPNVGFHKRGYPQIINFDRIVLYKPSILGYPHFWKPQILPNRLLETRGASPALRRPTNWTGSPPIRSGWPTPHDIHNVESMWNDDQWFNEWCCLGFSVDTKPIHSSSIFKSAICRFLQLHLWIHMTLLEYQLLWGAWTFSASLAMQWPAAWNNRSDLWLWSRLQSAPFRIPAKEGGLAEQTQLVGWECDSQFMDDDNPTILNGVTAELIINQQRLWTLTTYASCAWKPHDVSSPSRYRLPS